LTEISDAGLCDDCLDDVELCQRRHDAVFDALSAFWRERKSTEFSPIGVVLMHDYAERSMLEQGYVLHEQRIGEYAKLTQWKKEK
jgi:hypothetical protein